MGFGVLLGTIILLAGSIANAQTTVDLTTRITPPTTPNVVVRWFTDAAHTNPLANPTSVVATSTPTNYWAFFYDTAGNCYSPGAKVTIVDAACPVKTVNLTALPGGNAPNLVWHSAPVPVTGTTEVPDPTAVGPGTYWAFFHDVPGDCYSPASSPVIVHGECSLPVTLISFNVLAEGQTANLKWATSSEANSKGFEIQRSGDAASWTKIGYTESQNSNSSSQLTYHFNDVSPLQGKNYYRLKMVDLDASFAYSRIVSVDMKGEMAYVSPNPTSGTIKLSKSNLSEVKKVELVNTNGQVVYKANQISAEGINVKGLVGNGAYVLRVNYADGSQSSHKIVISN